MYISKRDIELLIKMENLIGCNEKILFENDFPYIVRWADGDVTVITKEDFNDFINLVEKMIQKRIEHNKKTTGEKRKINKMYARSKKEKENK